MRRVGVWIAVLLWMTMLAGVGWLWLRSHRQTDDVFRYQPERMTRVRSSGGGFWFETRPWPSDPSNSAPAVRWEHQIYTDRAQYPFAAAPDGPWWERAGFLWSTEGYDLLIVAPYWGAMLGAIVLGLVVAWLVRRTRGSTQDDGCSPG